MASNLRLTFIVIFFFPVFSDLKQSTSRALSRRTRIEAEAYFSMKRASTSRQGIPRFFSDSSQFRAQRLSEVINVSGEQSFRSFVSFFTQHWYGNIFAKYFAHFSPQFHVYSEYSAVQYQFVINKKERPTRNKTNHPRKQSNESTSQKTISIKSNIHIRIHQQSVSPRNARQYVRKVAIKKLNSSSIEFQ